MNWWHTLYADLRELFTKQMATQARAARHNRQRSAESFEESLSRADATVLRITKKPEPEVEKDGD